MARIPESYGTVVLSDGAAITHGLGRVPKSVNVQPSVAGTTATVTNVTATTITVALKTTLLNLGLLSLTPAASQTVYWWAA